MLKDRGELKVLLHQLANFSCNPLVPEVYRYGCCNVNSQCLVNRLLWLGNPREMLSSTLALQELMLWPVLCKICCSRVSKTAARILSSRCCALLRGIRTISSHCSVFPSFHEEKTELCSFIDTQLYTASRKIGLNTINCKMYLIFYVFLS